MIFEPTKSMNIAVLKEQENQISSAKTISEAIKKKNVKAFDIIDNKKVIGFVMLRRFDKNKFFLWDFAIDKNFQNRGYGTVALKELIQMLKENFNCTELTTTYVCGNNHAKALYEKQGFVETEFVDDGDIHEVNMQLKL